MGRAHGQCGGCGHCSARLPLPGRGGCTCPWPRRQRLPSGPRGWVRAERGGAFGCALALPPVAHLGSRGVWLFVQLRSQNEKRNRAERQSEPQLVWTRARSRPRCSDGPGRAHTRHVLLAVRGPLPRRGQTQTLWALQRGSLTSSAVGSQMAQNLTLGGPDIMPGGYEIFKS